MACKLISHELAVLPYADDVRQIQYCSRGRLLRCWYRQIRFDVAVNLDQATLRGTSAIC